jgi:type VI secretion system protein ImpA
MIHASDPSNPPAGAVPDWLQPISSSQPCGASLEYDAEYAVLLSRMTPRGEAQYGQFVGTSDAPNWAEIERDCRRLLLRTRDIGLFVWLCRARTRQNQAAGLAQVLSMLEAALRSWPEAIHPQLVIEGQADPEVRANALAALVDPEGLMSDVREIVVASSTALRLTVRDVERAFAVPRPADAQSPESVSRQLAALHAAAGRDAQAPVKLLAQAAQHVREIDAWSKAHLGDDAPSLRPLVRLLDMFVTPETANAAPLENASRDDQAAPHEGGWHADASASTDPGTWLRSGQGAATRVEMLGRIRSAREWFEAHEPSSPVAVLLKQAERMVGKRFHEVADAIPLDLLKKWALDDDAVGEGAEA